MINYVTNNGKWREYGHDLDENTTAYADTDLLESVHGVMSRLMSLKQNIASYALGSIGLEIFNKTCQNLKELQKKHMIYLRL